MKVQKPDPKGRTKAVKVEKELTESQLDNLKQAASGGTLIYTPKKRTLVFPKAVANLVHTRLSNWGILWINL